MDLKDVPADDFVWSWDRAEGVTARAAELLEALGHGRHQLGAVEEHAELLRSRGLTLRPLRRRGRFIPEAVLLSTACEFRRRLIYKRKARRQTRLNRLMKPFCLTWESSPDVKTALEKWKSITGRVVGRLPFRKLASVYRKMGLSLKLMN
jgi:hypothetical protein